MNKDQVIAKVQALLNHAAGTKVQAEAEAFTQKAQELMARYRIEEAEVIKEEIKTELPIKKQIFIDNGDTHQRLELIVVLAEANEVEVVFSDTRGFMWVMLIGYSMDVEYVECLYNSLRFPMMNGAYELKSPYGIHSHTRSLRQGFIKGFVSAIRNRLQEAKQRLQEENDLEFDRLLQEYDETFTSLKRKREEAKASASSVHDIEQQMQEILQEIKVLKMKHEDWDEKVKTYGLIEVSKKQQVNLYKTELYPKLKTAKERHFEYDRVGLRKGYEAGSKVALAKGSIK